MKKTNGRRIAEQKTPRKDKWLGLVDQSKGNIGESGYCLRGKNITRSGEVEVLAKI
jgi:hypothetical protein